MFLSEYFGIRSCFETIPVFRDMRGGVWGPSIAPDRDSLDSEVPSPHEPVPHLVLN